MRPRRASPAAFILALANDHGGYFTTAAQYQAGTYEGTATLYGEDTRPVRRPGSKESDRPGQMTSRRRRALARAPCCWALWAVCALASRADDPARNRLPADLRRRRVDGTTARRWSAACARTLLGGTPGDLRPGDRLLRDRRAPTCAARDRSASSCASSPRSRARPRRWRSSTSAPASRATTTVVPGSTLLFLPLLLAAPVFAVVAVVLVAPRARERPAARAFVVALTNQAFYLAGNFGGAPYVTYAAMAVHVVDHDAGRAADAARLPAVSRPHAAEPERAALAVAVRGARTCCTPRTSAWPVPPRLGNAAAALVVVAMLIACVAVATRAYRRADPIGRRRVKWVLLGAYGAAMPPIADRAALRRRSGATSTCTSSAWPRSPACRWRY